MQIDPKSTVPVFKQVAQEIQSAIAAGIYREGEAIPSARELAMRLRVNPNTIQKAFDELSHLGVIETRRGLGKFVQQGALKNSAKRSKQEIVEVFQSGLRIATAAGFTRDEIDKLYRLAVKNVKVDRPKMPSRKKGNGAKTQ